MYFNSYKLPGTWYYNYTNITELYNKYLKF